MLPSLSAKSLEQRSGNEADYLPASENLAEKMLSDLESESKRCNPVCPETIEELKKDGIYFEGIDEEYIYFSYPVRSTHNTPRYRGDKVQSEKVAQEALRQIPNLKFYKREQLAKEITQIVRASNGKN